MTQYFSMCSRLSSPECRLFFRISRSFFILNSVMVMVYSFEFYDWLRRIRNLRVVRCTGRNLRLYDYKSNMYCCNLAGVCSLSLSRKAENRRDGILRNRCNDTLQRDFIGIPDEDPLFVPLFSSALWIPLMSASLPHLRSGLSQKYFRALE